MHVSCDLNSKHYTKEAFKMRCFVNDVEVTNDCFEACEEQGFALVYKRRDGERYLDKYGDVAWEKLTGTVRLEYK